MIHDPSKWAYRALSILVALLMIWIVLWGIPHQAGAAPRPKPCVGRIDPSYSNIGLVRIVRKDGSTCVRPATNTPQAPKRAKP